VSQSTRCTVVDVSGVVFWAVTPCGLIGGSNGSEEYGASILKSTSLRMEAVGSSETSLPIYEATRCRALEAKNPSS
jgi:hypothetical protein